MHYSANFYYQQALELLLIEFLFCLAILAKHYTKVSSLTLIGKINPNVEPLPISELT